MNAAIMRNRIRFHIDKYKNPRIKQGLHIDQAINIAINDFIEDRYDNIKKARGSRNYYFQAVQRVRDELRTLVKSATIVPVNSIISLPSDYRHEAGLEVVINGNQVHSIGILYNELSKRKQNYFLKPTDADPFHYESELGITVEAETPPTSSVLYYLKKPATVVLSETSIVAGTTLIVGQTYIVTGTTPVTYNGTVYNTDEDFVVDITSTVHTGGNVVTATNSDLPDHAHEEICKRAAAYIGGHGEDYNKLQTMDMSVQKN